jgi:hypothetical protein
MEWAIFKLSLSSYNISNLSFSVTGKDRAAGGGGKLCIVWGICTITRRVLEDEVTGEIMGTVWQVLLEGRGEEERRLSQVGRTWPSRRDRTWGRVAQLLETRTAEL